MRLGPLLGVLFAIQYAYFLTRNYYWDGVSFAIDIEKACTFRDLFKVHHLLSNFIGCGEYLLFSRGVRSLYLMQWTNCIAGGVLIWLAYRLLRSLEVPWMNSAACAAISGGGRHVLEIHHRRGFLHPGEWRKVKNTRTC